MSDQFTPSDYVWMSRAIALAENGRFTTAPNPNVGCVIVRDGEMVGEGYHYRAGEPHAEVHAMRMAGDKCRGATAYVTLEPCSHYGRTPPCSKGLIDAGIHRVVCSMIDPHSKVAGKGFAMLREAGVEVAVGIMEQEARALNKGFIKRMETGLPFVQLKMGATLDGQTALANGLSQWITGSEARKDVQSFRAQAGGILSTSQTVIADNASLSVRWDELPDHVQASYKQKDLRQPKKVILDRQGRLTSDLNLFRTEGDVITVGPQGDVEVGGTQQGLALKTALSQLAKEQEINHLWVEAGATLAGSLLKENLVDEIVLYIAPKLIGSDGRGLFANLGLERCPSLLN